MKQLAGIAWFLVACWVAAGVWRIGSQPMVQLATPKETKVVNQIIKGLPDIAGMKAKVKR